MIFVRRSKGLKLRVSRLSCGLAGALMLAGCVGAATAPDEDSYPDLYQRQIESHTPSSSADTALTQDELRERFSGFIDFFSELREEDIARRAREIYSSDLYFNDTLKTFSSRSSLVSYLEETAQRVEFNRVDVSRIVPFGDDYFMQWSMRSGFRVFGNLIETESIGITHLRLDDEGKVNFHQDFWDNTQGLFSHLPVVGYVVRHTRDRM